MRIDAKRLPGDRAMLSPATRAKGSAGFVDRRL
jgi:hypothetical protein